jgi:hypothetical protein
MFGLMKRAERLSYCGCSKTIGAMLVNEPQWTSCQMSTVPAEGVKAFIFYYLTEGSDGFASVT